MRYDIFKKKISLENIKKRSQKLLITGPKLFFHKYGQAAQTSPELIFHIIKCREQASVLLSVVSSSQSSLEGERLGHFFKVTKPFMETGDNREEI